MISKIQFKMGSSYFFDGYKDYIQKDYDELNIMDSWLKDARSNILKMKLKGNNKDIFFCKNLSKDEFIEDALNSNVPMRVGKFLIPEFAEYIKMNISDLKRLEPLIHMLDPKHKYEKIIYDSYIKNNGFFLTDEQLEKAYKEYKKYRPDIYNKTED